MRADRLLSILMILQERGKIPAVQLAEELEVSVRTIYRDIDALNFAGIPIYGETGPEGGYSLLDTYRSSLTGLNEREIRALFMLGIPDSLMKMGAGQELKSAFLKLSTSLSGGRYDSSKKIHLDPEGWQRQDEGSIPHLQKLYKAVEEDRTIIVRLKTPFPSDQELTVEPLGLVAKSGVWYLVYGIHGNIRAVQVLSVMDVSVSNDSFERPVDFDLEEFWKRWSSQREDNLRSYPVQVIVSRGFIPILSRYFGQGIAEGVEKAVPDSRGRIVLELLFDSIESARDRILGFGGAVEVLEPPALRRSIQDYAEQIRSLYGEEPGIC